MLRWYLIHTKRARENTAQEHLARQGYELYLPRLAHSVKCGGRWQQRVTALFPVYLFLRLNEGTQSLGPVRSTVGIINVVRFGSKYATVPDSLVVALKERADPQSGLHKMELPALPETGSLVKVSDGPFDGLEGVFERESADDRVVVLLNLLGQRTRVCLPIESIVPRLAA